jgi:5-methyltetrahydropteroyltriglutamate--homocysteine methyltransferase
MNRSTERILVTHAGSLPRPDDLIEMIWARMDGQEVDEAALEQRVASAIDEVVRKQLEVGVDIVSDGELGKPGFSTYVEERFDGFSGRSEFQADDVAPFPNLAMRLFATDSMAHVVFSNCEGEVRLRDADAVHRDIETFTAALHGRDPGDAFMGAISPGQIAFNYPDHHYGSHEAYLGALAEALGHEYRAIADAGFNLQIDSPDLAMAAHSRSVGSSITS